MRLRRGAPGGYRREGGLRRPAQFLHGVHAAHTLAQEHAVCALLHAGDTAKPLQAFSRGAYLFMVYYFRCFA